MTPYELSEEGIEVWENIPKYGGVYQVSNLGRVHSSSRIALSKRWGTQKVKGGILTPITHKKHLCVRLALLGEREERYIHELVLTTFVGPCPEGMECRHLKDDPSDNRLHMILWGTYEENAWDAVWNDKKVRKIPLDIIDDIKIRYSLGGITQQELAKELGVSYQTIQYYLRRVAKCK